MQNDLHELLSLALYTYRKDVGKIMVSDIKLFKAWLTKGMTLKEDPGLKYNDAPKYMGYPVIENALGDDDKIYFFDKANKLLGVITGVNYEEDENGK